MDALDPVEAPIPSHPFGGSKHASGRAAVSWWAVVEAADGQDEVLDREREIGRGFRCWTIPASQRMR